MRLAASMPGVSIGFREIWPMVPVHRVGAGWEAHPSKWSGPVLSFASHAVKLLSSYDVRVMEVTLDCTTTPVQMSLEFEGPARQAVTQDIPLSNNGDKPLQLRAALQGGEAFSGPSTITLDPQSTSTYPLTFRAPWVGEYKGRLELVATGTNESTLFTLQGTAGEPVAEGHVVLECPSKAVLEHVFRVPNVMGNRDVVYSVFSDLPAVRGEPEIVVRGRGVADYPVRIRPSRSGTTMGSITFTAPSGHYCWYTIELRATAPAPVDMVDVSCEVRKAVSLDIPLVNPLDREVEMEVRLEGPGLLGKPRVVLAPLETSTYRVFYSPLTEGGAEGRVYFSSEHVGEHWYLLRLSAHQPAPEALPEMVCELGRTAKTVITVANPLPQEVVLQAAVSNQRSFAMSPATVSVAPFAEASFHLDYSASTLDEQELAVVTITGAECGRWEFTAAGHGVPPTAFEETRYGPVSGAGLCALVLNSASWCAGWSVRWASRAPTWFPGRTPWLSRSWSGSPLSTTRRRASGSCSDKRQGEAWHGTGWMDRRAATQLNRCASALVYLSAGLGNICTPWPGAFHPGIIRPCLGC